MKTEGLVTKAEGLDFLRVVGKGMGHAVDKDSARLMKTFHDEHAAKGSDPYPRKIRFATYTLKYNKVGWLAIQRLSEHYRRATVEAEVEGDVAIVRTENVAAIAVAREVGETLRLDGQEFPLREAARGLLPDVYFQKLDKGWELLDHDASLALQENDRARQASRPPGADRRRLHRPVPLRPGDREPRQPQGPGLGRRPARRGSPTTGRATSGATSGSRTTSTSPTRTSRRIT